MIARWDGMSNGVISYSRTSTSPLEHNTGVLELGWIPNILKLTRVKFTNVLQIAYSVHPERKDQRLSR